VFDRVRKEKPDETPTDWDYATAYFDIHPEAYDDRESVNAYLFRTFENFMEMLGLVTTKRHWDGERRCPPEDCGGATGYQEISTLAN
jgi:hypothetical protein